METETELQASRRSTERKSGENGGVQLKPLQPLPQLGKGGLFKLPHPETDDDDDDGNDCISLKEWQPKEAARSPSSDGNGTSYSAWQPVKERDASSNGAPVKGSVRSRPIGYVPLVESNGDVCLPPSIHAVTLPKLPSHQPEVNGEEDEEEDDQDNGTYEDGLEDLGDGDEGESAKHTMEPEATGNRLKGSHHQHNISLVNGIAPQPDRPTGGISFDISLDDQDDSRSRRSTGSSRGSSLRVSFINEVVLDSPSPPRHNNKSPFRPRPNQSKSPAKSKPSWDSSAKIGKPAPPPPKKFVRPTLHGIKVKKGQGGVMKQAVRASTSALETDNRSFVARVGRPREPREPREAVSRSWDLQQYVGGGEYDSVSQLISKSLVSEGTKKEENNKKGESNGVVASKPGRPFLPRSNGAGKNAGDHGVTQNGAEALKPKDLGNGGGNESKLTGDITKLFSKALRRASAPLSKPPSKQAQQAVAQPKPPSATPVVGKINRANSTPVEAPKVSGKKTLAPLHSLDSTGANQKYSIGSYASLKLLQECAQTEKIAPAPAFNAHKPRKIRDHEPHRHYYKTISKTLDSKLKEFHPIESKSNAPGIRGKKQSDSMNSSYGLWDDLPGRFVVVPLAAWALATWAQASNENRSIIKCIDKDGDALLAAVVAPERPVRWHGALAMKFLLQNMDKEFDEVAARWSSALLEMAAEASTYKDMGLASSALTTFAACISQSQHLAAHEARRKAIVESGDGLVLDWLLKAVGGSRPACQFTQAEASRALSYLLQDVNTSESVLGRPHALPYLLHFAATIHVNDAVESLISGKKDQIAPEGRGVSRGKSLLVAAIIDLVTTSCDSGDQATCFRPMLPGKADPADVAAVLQVVEGGWLVDDDEGPGDSDGNDRGGLRGIGLPVLGGTEIVGVQNTSANLSQQGSYFDKITCTSSFGSLLKDPSGLRLVWKSFLAWP